MAEETVVAATSAAAEEPTFTQFDGWDEDGTPVVSKKEEAGKQDKPEEADSAAADTSKETKPEDEADSAAKPKQETRRKPDAETRIKELAAETKRLKQELEEARKPKETKPAESSTARQAEQKPAQPEATRPKPTLQDKGSDGKPLYASYEEFQEGLTDWKMEQKFATIQREQQTAQQSQKWLQEINEARGRYADYDTVAIPLVGDLMKPEVSDSVRSVLMASPVLADLLYTIGGTEASKADFLEACRTDPGKALRVALLMERDITEELGKGKGKKEATPEVTPAAPKPRAPKPPAEVGGRGAPGEDALIAAAKTNDFRSFDAEQTKRALASRR